jgi:hypothetical protein
MIGEAAQAGLQVRPDGRRVIKDLALGHQLKVFQRDGGGDRVSRIGEAMAEHADAIALLQYALVNFVADHDG